MKNKGDIALISKWGKNILRKFSRHKNDRANQFFFKKIDKEEHEGD